MNSVETLEYYQKKSGYRKIDYKEMDMLFQKIISELNVDALTEDKERMKESFLKTMETYSKKLPTKYQDVNMYALLDGLFNQIQDAAQKLPDKSRLVFPEKVTYGTVHINQFTALVKNNDGNDDYLIMVSDCMFMFANLLAKSIGMLMNRVADKEENEHFAFDISKEGISASLRDNFEAIIRFTDLILAYIVTGQASSAQQYTPDLRLAAITELIRNSYELFVVGHEYSHILLGHLQKEHNADNVLTREAKIKDEIINLVITNWYEEHEDDIQAAVLTISAMQGYDFATSYMGVDICLITLIILERINDLLDTKTDAVPSHPPAENRRKFIFDVLSNGHQEIKDIYDIDTYIVDSLWERCMHLILEINKIFEEKLEKKITEIDYGFTRHILYKIGKAVLTEYNTQNPLE